jgi:fucose permease
MENENKIQTLNKYFTVNSSGIYLTRLIHYGGYGILLGGLTSMIFRLSIKRGIIVGFAIGAGYCHTDFTKAVKNIFSD